MKLPKNLAPIVPVFKKNGVELFIKREDLIHPQISGNKYWKLFNNINNYLAERNSQPSVVTFGGAFSNHIAATAAVGKEFHLNTLGIIRGEELENNWQQNPTLKAAQENGMEFRFISRERYRDKEKMTAALTGEFPHALIIPEGGSNETAVDGIQLMLSSETKSFDYLCAAVGTGGTIAGISKFAESHQQVIGFTVVNDSSLHEKILHLSKKNNFTLLEAHDGGYGKINNDNVRFINDFKMNFGIQLDPVYTGKMMRKIFDLIEENYFPAGSSILAFHTGGLQGIAGANELLKKKNKILIEV